MISTLRRFAQDTRGNIAVIAVLVIVPLLVMAGGATDIARHEAHRSQLQDSIDRAVLAAASLKQTKTIDQTVRDYIKTLPFANHVSFVPTSTTSTNSRVVTVTASYAMPTHFLPLIGKSHLNITAKATAQEKRTNIEISLILDMSGSMRFLSSSAGNARKIDLLKPAAKQFINTILTTESAAYTSVNVVPYAGQVNVGSVIFNALGGHRTHNNSSCFETIDSDYAAGLPNLNGRAQVPHFTNSNFGQNVADMDWWWCPGEIDAISIFADSASTLRTRIDNYRMSDGTGTAVAMNWGLLLLNPTLRPYVQQAAGAGLVPQKFANRPANWNDQNTMKFIVLMTDGEVSNQYRPKDPNRATNIAPDNYTSQARSAAVTKLYAVCNSAKTNGVTVFTIGFEVPAGFRTEMQTCASSTSHYYPVTGLDISTAFQSIATAIQKIKLTN